MEQSLKVLFEQAKAVMQYSYSPYSNYRVGCCLRTKTGHQFVGTNVENAAYGATVCAEVCAITNMVAHIGASVITEILVVASSDCLCRPCGNCRQCIVEFATAETYVYMCNHSGQVETRQLRELMPHAFILPHTEDC